MVTAWGSGIGPGRCNKSGADQIAPFPWKEDSGKKQRTLQVRYLVSRYVQELTYFFSKGYYLLYTYEITAALV